MLKLFQIALLSLFVAMLAGCSVQKRTLMPGYHVEWGGGQNAIETSESPTSKLAFLEGKQVNALSQQLPESALHGSTELIRKAEEMKYSPSILSQAIPFVCSPATLVDPTPWDEVYKEQKMFGKLAFLAFVLGGVSPLLLAQYLSLSSATLLINLFGLLALILFIVNRRKRKQVLEIKEANGVDTSGERWRPGRKAAVGAGAVASLAWVWVAIMTALFAALFSAIESALTFGWI